MKNARKRVVIARKILEKAGISLRVGKNLLANPGQDVAWLLDAPAVQWLKHWGQEMVLLLHWHPLLVPELPSIVAEKKQGSCSIEPEQKCVKYWEKNCRTG